MKDKYTSVVFGGIISLGLLSVSMTHLFAQEVLLDVPSVPVNTSEEVQNSARTRQQNIRAEQLQRQRSNNVEQNQPIRSNATSEEVPSEQREQGELNSNRQQRMMERCEIISSNIARHKERFSTKSETRVKVYNKIVARLEVVSNRLGESGVDVTLLNTYISDIKSKVISFENSSNTYSNSSQSTTELCSQDEVQNTIDLKKQELQIIIEQDKEIRKMVRETIIPYLKALRPVSTEPSESQPSDESTTQTPVTTPIQ